MEERIQPTISISIVDESIPVEQKLETLPTGPGVYQHKDADGTVLYVGKAKNLRNRVRQYFQKSRSMDRRIELMVQRATDLEIIVTDSEVEALILEANLIKKLRPRYNVNLKDDKSYPYIVITNEPYPRVFVTRHIRRDGSHYFGPYTDVKNVRAALKAVREIFMIRSCNYALDAETIARKKYKLCLDYHIKKCEGPCEGLVTQERYRSMIDQVAAVLRGKTESLIQRLQTEMQTLSAEMKYEDAALVRDRIKGLQAYSERQKVASLDAADRDIVAFASEADDACGVIFAVREGKMIGRRHYYMNNVENKPRLRDSQYSAATALPRGRRPAAGDSDFSAEPDDAPTLEQWLSSRRDSSVAVRLPAPGEETTLVNLSRSNAQLSSG